MVDWVVGYGFLCGEIVYRGCWGWGFAGESYLMGHASARVHFAVIAVR